MNGPGPALELLVKLFTNSGDCIIAPRPCYATLFVDWWIKARVSLFLADAEEKENFEISIESLEETYQKAIKAGSQPKALFISQICNPTGRLYSQKSLKNCLKWAHSKKIHIISDEVYCLSMLKGKEHLSLIKVRDDCIKKVGSPSQKYKDFLINYIHVVGGLSKDFGLSGIRFGIIYTEN